MGMVWVGRVLAFFRREDLCYVSVNDRSMYAKALERLRVSAGLGTRGSTYADADALVGHRG